MADAAGGQIDNHQEQYIAVPWRCHQWATGIPTEASYLRRRDPLVPSVWLEDHERSVFVAISARIEDNVESSADSSNTSNNFEPYDVCSKQPEYVYGAGCYIDIEGLTASKASILSDMCKIAGISLVVALSQTEYVPSQTDQSKSLYEEYKNNH